MNKTVKKALLVFLGELIMSVPVWLMPVLLIANVLYWAPAQWTHSFFVYNFWPLPSYTAGTAFLSWFAAGGWPLIFVGLGVSLAGLYFGKKHDLFSKTVHTFLRGIHMLDTKEKLVLVGTCLVLCLFGVLSLMGNALALTIFLCFALGVVKS
ncbi:MAG: hypothetical protein UW68_C0022G0007 [Candidatus Collierbacteria bacterium GW2011_GWB1_44_6]|uniref:Uncharacterized protein n=2 Tax=Candidatus Collieribacteriota TaxID=1752725 RepID=A0A0G1MLG8_9BACT|nr:MAG: hypothetical protein UV68_C0011G0013 [Candidatus Collierbacteria bacterium GW2011_GWC2_43_12]KKT72869.1 MAG: hypothetical protein UW68_C0022G0007 [Candidatus Collierbacteria bacterium GW2011_GWB1_44_6]KKT82331.1 MAG: hypothetical protein UW80_C0039G0009 [Microgenomates group bacterium GW2011_GWC1_44_9]